MIQKVLVLGGGSAGFLAAITLKSKLPQLQVTVVRSPEIGIIGVGEGSTPILTDHLHGYLNVPLADFYREAEPSWKLGIRFLWGPRPAFNYTFQAQLDTQYLALSKPTGFYAIEGFDHSDVASSLMSLDRAFTRQPNGAPFIGRDAAYHLENETFVRFLESFARRIDVQIADDTVQNVISGEAGIAELRLQSGTTACADLYVDCSGFRSVLLGQTLGEPFVSFKSSLLCDRAVVGGWTRGAEPIKPYTTAETMDAGWCWQIEHERRINRGYVYSSDFISDEAAEQEFRRKNPQVQATRIVRFVSGRYQRAWVGNVIAVGNAAGFVEPLESTSLGMICEVSQALVESLRDGDGHVTPSLRAAFNKRNNTGWDNIRRFLAVHYRFNTRLETPFWKTCQQEVDLAGAEPIVDYYRENGPSTMWRDTLIGQFDQFKMDGYLTLLVGQRVPFQPTFQPTADEQSKWHRIQQKCRAEAAQALTVEESLALIRAPSWQWNQDFYRQPK